MTREEKAAEELEWRRINEEIELSAERRALARCVFWLWVKCVPFKSLILEQP